MTIMHSECVTEAGFVCPLKTCCFYCQKTILVNEKSVLGDSQYCINVRNYQMIMFLISFIPYVTGYIMNRVEYKFKYVYKKPLFYQQK